MNRGFSRLILSIVLLVFFVLSSINLPEAQAQPQQQNPGGPPPPPGHGFDDDQPFEEAPIGGGLVILLTLGAIYGAKKAYQCKTKR